MTTRELIEKALKWIERGGIDSPDIRLWLNQALTAHDTERQELQERLRPSEFLATELLSLEQIMPLSCRAEANAVIDVFFAEISKLQTKLDAEQKDKERIRAECPKCGYVFKVIRLQAPKKGGV